MAMASTGVATISLEASVEAALRRAEAQEQESQSQDFTIFRVPAYIRESNTTAFEPRMVSIGPYYHGSPSLRAMEDHKWRCLHFLLSTSSSLTLTSAILIEKVRSLEPRARACYSESPQLGPDEFVRMLLLDGCFILEFFFKRAMKEPDTLCDVGWVRTLINTDLLLLENQIPFFVVEELYKTVVGEDRESLLNLIHPLLGNEKPIARPSTTCEIHHLLHLYYQSFVPKHSSPICRREETAAATRRGIPCGKEMSATKQVPIDDYDDGIMTQAAPVTVDNDRQPKVVAVAASVTVDIDQQPKEVPIRLGMVKKAGSVTRDIEQDRKETAATIRGIPCAKEMSAAGVTIVRSKEARHKYDVTFDRKRGVMEIPTMVVDDMTQRPLLMNLIAFEQTLPKGVRSLVVTSYVTLMSMVIRTENDVELLRRAEILDNLLADDNEAARFFSHLADGVAMDYDNQRFAQLYKDVQAYCRSWRHRNRAVLMRDYFGSPWSAIAVVAAALVFMLTATQTYFTIFPAKG